jgi:hypothetical protein
MEYLDSIDGLKRESAGSGRSYVITCPESEDLAKKIIEGLPEDRELMFYDKSHESPSEPGAYVMVRTFSMRYICSLGNHGWATGWRRRGKNSLVEYLGRTLSTSGGLWLNPCDPAKAQKILRLPGRAP